MGVKRPRICPFVTIVFLYGTMSVNLVVNEIMSIEL